MSLIASITLALVTQCDPATTITPRAEIFAPAGSRMQRGDFNGDGIPDIAFLQSLGFNTPIAVALGTGDGAFTLPATLPGNLFDFVICDLDADGALDLVTCRTDEVAIRRGAGDGTFTFAEEIIPITGGGRFVDVADFDSDGDLDIVHTTTATEGQRVYVHRNDDGAFVLAVSRQTDADQSNRPVVGDVTGDGRPDIVLNGATEFYLLDTDATTHTLHSFETGIQLRQLHIADLDGDGLNDLLCFHFPGGITTIRAFGGGFFHAAESHLTEHTFWSIAPTDVNGDGATDLAALTSEPEPQLHLFTNDGTGTLSSSAQFPVNLDTPRTIAALRLGTAPNNTTDDYLIGAQPNLRPFINTCNDTPPPPTCAFDHDGDGIVGFGDLVALLSAWGACE